MNPHMELSIVKKVIACIAGALVLYGLAFFVDELRQERFRKTGDITIKQYPLDTLAGLIDLSGGTIDKTITTDGNGSLRIPVTGTAAVHLYDTGKIDVQNSKVKLKAMVRTDNFSGSVRLEMRLKFSGGKNKQLFPPEYAFTSLCHDPLTGTTDWRPVQAEYTCDRQNDFILGLYQNLFDISFDRSRPENIELYVVIEGKSGTVWVDDLRLEKGFLDNMF
jgi:hypothetical protein